MSSAQPMKAVEFCKNSTLQNQQNHIDFSHKEHI